MVPLDYIDDEAEDNVVLSPRSRRKRTERKTFIREGTSPEHFTITPNKLFYLYLQMC